MNLDCIKNTFTTVSENNSCLNIFSFQKIPKLINGNKIYEEGDQDQYQDLDGNLNIVSDTFPR